MRISNVQPNVREQNFNRLMEEVLQRNIHPEDRYEIAATLESMGWNDERAFQLFGVADVFELAEELWEAIHQKVVFASFAKPEEKGGLRLLYEMVKSFLRGLIFALPMAISVLSMLSLKFSLWSYEYLSVELATSIAVGTILSFVCVGGFTQAIARRGFFYLYQGYYNMGRRVTFLFIRWGYITCLVMSGAIYLFNFVFNIYPQGMMFIMLLYFFFLNSIWLSVTVMYILRKEITFTGLIILGIFIVYLVFEVLGADIILAQLIAMSVVSVIGIALVVFYFKMEERKEEKGIVPKLPRLSIIVYTIMPYFVYGFLYFLFLFMDRVMAWSANEEFMPYFIWFRGEYELGLDFALLMLMMPLGVSEVLVHKLMLDLETSQKGLWGFETDKLSRRYLGRYYKMMAIISVSSIISAVFIWILLVYSNERYLAYAGKYLIASYTTYFVFFCALISYALLAVGLMNAVILFSLSQPQLVNRALLPAVFTNVAVGFLLSRWVEYSYAIFGLLAGTIVFVILSSRQMTRVLRKLDYYLYTAS